MRGKRVGIAVLALLTALLSGCAASDEPVASTPSKTESTETLQPADCDGVKALEHSAQECAEVLADQQLAPPLEERAADIGTSFDCFTYPDERALKECAAIDASDGDVRIALVGDSHAAMLSGALTTSAEAQGWSLHTIASNGCVWTNSPDLPECADRLAQQEQVLLGGEPFDVVIVTSLSSDDVPDESQAIINERFGQLEAAGSQVVVVQDNPQLSDESEACLESASEDAVRAGECDVPISTAYQHMDQYWQAAHGRSDVTAIPTQDLFCSDDVCPIVIGDTVVYRDAHHVTATYASVIGEILFDRIIEQVPEL